MKVNEIQIGDWVDFHHYYETEKKIMTRHRVTEVFECGLVGISNHPNPVHADHIEPVKITAEILEKIGFVPYEDDEESFHDGDCVFIKQRLGGYGVCLNKIRTISGVFHYVHELQHALRLCGIAKTIELLKVTSIGMELSI